MGCRVPAGNAVLGGVTALASTRGRVTLLAFLDAACTRRCPFLGRAIGEARALLPASSRPPVLVVSLDPSSDGARRVRAALASFGAGAGWRWLSGSRRQLERVWRAYGITSGRGGSVSGDSVLYLIDPRGDERAGYLPPLLPNFLALDIRRLEGARIPSRRR